MKKTMPILYVIAAALLLAPAPSAKTRAADSGDYSLSPTDLETKLRPILEERVNSKRGGNGGAKKGSSSTLSVGNPSINQRDLFTLMKVWNNMSPEFRALYEEATAIPKEYNHYISPGGNFKVFYTTVGQDSVSGIDTMSYGQSGQPDRWREKRLGANGIPDYVDEAAFALDSAWSMEITRFGFPQPKNAADPAGSTAQYCAVIVKSSDYGVTYPTPKSSSTQAGFASYIELNGNWSGRDWAGLGYNERPYDALRVTCAHEFFHSIQYSMVWTIDLDNLTYGWLEGSAVLMEELAFPDINDYLQYVSSYFSNPRIPLLSNNDNYIYMNSIVIKYLYERAIPGGGIGIVKAVQENNLAHRNITFHQNITTAVSNSTGREWATTLNGFHAESYFTGARARPWAFVSDAKLMGAWRAPTAATGADTSANIGSYSVGLFMYKPQADHNDTLTLLISGQSDASTSGATWGASAIVTESAGDSAGIVPITVDKNGNGRLILADWKSKSGCLLVATNAGSTTKRVTVKITDQSDTTTLSAALRIFPNKVNMRKSNPIRILGGDISEATITALNGKIVDRWSANGKAMGSGGSAFTTNANGSLEWSPTMLKRRAVPGVYFITASSTNPATGEKSTQRRKIMLLP